MGFLKTHVTTRADRISNFQATTCDYGTAVLDIFGTTRVAPNVINWQDFYSREIRKTVKSGKSKSTTINYRYYVYLELALGETITDIGKIWVGDTMYQSLGAANGSGGTGFPLELKKDGGVSNYMSTKHPDKAVDYQHLAYLHSPSGGNASGTYLGENSASVPSYGIEVKGALLSTGDGIDANPADVILYILTKLGIYNGVDPEETIISGIGNFRKYCKANDLLISSPSGETSQKKAQEIIKDICTLTDAYFFWSNNKFKIRVKDNRQINDWRPDNTVVYDLGPDDMLLQSDGACVAFSRKDSSEVYNRFTVEFCNRSNSYENETVSYELSNDISKTGLRQMSTQNALYFYKKERAIKVCQMLARKNERERNKYTIKLDWAYCILEPGDLVTLSDPIIGLNKQIAMVDTVTEAKDGSITVDCLQYIDGNYNAGIVDVSGSNYNYVDYNIEPSNTDRPIIFQPPSAATLSGNEIWIALRGVDNTWGGCNILVANQDANYQSLGQYRMSSSYGTLAADMASSNADSFTAVINGDFDNVTTLDAQNANSMMWIDGECLSYTTARKNSNGTWTFSGLIRGQYNTNIVSHRSGSTVVSCDGALYVIEITKKDIGRQLYFKFPSVNVFNSNPQNEADVDYYTYTVKDYAIPSASDIIAYTRYYQSEDAVSYSIQVTWTPPDLATYARSQVWYKVKGDRDWTYADSGVNSATIPNAMVGETYTIAVCVEDIYGAYEDPDSARQTSITVQTKAVTPNAPESVSVKFGSDIVVKWDFVGNADVRYYEVRLDNNPGVVGTNFLGRTTSNSLVINLTQRSGTIYVYAYGANKIYSVPGSVTYNLSKPPQPKPPELIANINSLTIRTTIPDTCHGMYIYINDEPKIYHNNGSYTYVGKPGIYDVAITYVDAIGESDKSPTVSESIRAYIDPDLIEAGSISSSKLDNIVNNNIQSATNKAALAVVKANGVANDLNNFEGQVYKKGETDTLIANSIKDFETNTLKPNYSTTTQTDTMIKSNVATYTDGILQGYSTKEQTSAAISSGLAVFKDRELSKYSTTTQTESLINTKVADYTDGILANYSTTEQTSTMISSTIANFKSTELSKYSTTTQTESLINSKVTDKLTGYSTTEQTSSMITNSINNFKDGVLADYSTTEQTKNLISSQVATYTDGKLANYSTIKQTNDAISSMVGKIDAATNDKLKSYSTIQQTQDAISLAVKNIDLDGNDIITKINIADGTILLDGKYVHITGDTQIDGSIITNNMLAGNITGDKIKAKAITTDKININGGKTSGARIEVIDNLITVYDDNNIARVKLGLIDEI